MTAFLPGMPPSEWKDSVSDGLDGHHNHKSSSGLNGLLSSMGLGRREAINGVSNLHDDPHLDACGDKIHPLYGHGVCKWPGCEVICDDFQAFIKWVDWHCILVLLLFIRNTCVALLWYFAFRIEFPLKILVLDNAVSTAGVDVSLYLWDSLWKATKLQIKLSQTTNDSTLI